MKINFNKNNLKYTIMGISFLLLFVALSLPSCSNYFLNLDKTPTSFVVTDDAHSHKYVQESDETATEEIQEDANTVNIHTELGIVEVNKSNVKIVSLFNEATETVVSLGKTPIALLNTINDNSAPAWIDMMYDYGMSDDVIILDTLNLETIKVLEPDLILGSYEIHGDYYEDLQEIAPTVFSRTSNTSFNKNYLIFSTAIGEKEKGEELLLNYFSKASMVSETYGISERERVSIIEIVNNESYLILEENFTAQVLKDLNYSFFNILSEESFKTPIELEAVTGNTIYMSVEPSLESEQIFNDWIESLRTENSIKPNLYVAPGHIWNITNGYISALEILKSIEYAQSNFDEQYKVDTIYKIDLH